MMKFVFSSSFLLTFAILWIAFSFAPTPVANAQQRSHPFLTPLQIELQQKLQAPAQSIGPYSMEEAVKILSKAYHIPFWIDRHVPRDRVVRVSGAERATLEDLLQRITEQADASILLIDGIVAIVPKESSKVIDQAAWDFFSRATPPQWQRKELKFGWEIGTTMQQVATELCQAFGMDSDWVNEVEHDIWPSQTFDNASRIAIASCVLSAMDRRLIWSDGKVQAVPLNRSEATPTKSQIDHQVAWSYSKQMIDQLGPTHCRAWRETHPDVQIERQANGVWKIQATPAEHRSLVAPLVPRKVWTIDQTSKAVFSGGIQGPFGAIVEGIGQKFQIEFFPLPLPPAVANKGISLQFENATLQEVLTRLAQEGGVEFISRGNGYEIVVRGER